MRSLLAPGVAALLLASAWPTAAEPYSQFVNFGDSLSDAGNFPDESSPLVDGNPTGGLRFTNRSGPTYSDDNLEYFAPVTSQILAQRLGLQALPSTPILPEALTGNPDGRNYAVGGYRSDQVLESIIDTSTVASDEFSESRSRPGYLRENPQADPAALYYLNGGANDVFQLLERPVPMSESAENLVRGVAALQNAGARYIIVADLPDLGATPLGNSIPFLDSLLDEFSEEFNEELQDQLRAQGGNYLLLNNRRLLDEVRGDLAAFGFDPAVDQNEVCFAGGACDEDSTHGVSSASPDPSRLLFYDSVHPTSAVHRISADYIYSIVAAPAQISQLPEVGRSALRSHWQQLDELFAAQRGDWQPAGNWRGFVQAAYHQRDYEGFASGDADSPTLAIGVTRRFGQSWLAGASLGLAEHSLTLGDARSDYEMRSYLATLFARYERNRLFADLSLSAGHLDYHDLGRTFDLGITRRMETGSTEGLVWGAGVNAGFNLLPPDARLQFGPLIGADWQRVEVDGYREAGSRSTALTFHDQQLDSLRLSLGLFADFRLSERVRLFGEVAREVEQEDDARDDLRLALNSVPGNVFELPAAAPVGDQTRASLGLAVRVSSGLSLSAHYRYLGDDQPDHGAGLSLAWDL